MLIYCIDSVINLFVRHMKASYIRCGSPTTTTQVMARKKRRGVNLSSVLIKKF